MAFKLIARRNVGRMWSAKSERNAKTLRGTNGGIRAELSRRFQQGQGQNIGGDDEQSACVMCCGRQLFVTVNRAIGCWILHERAKDPFVELEIGKTAGDDLNSERLGALFDDFNRLRMTVVRHEKFVAGATRRSVITQT